MRKIRGVQDKFSFYLVNDRLLPRVQPAYRYFLAKCLLKMVLKFIKKEAPHA